MMTRTSQANKSDAELIRAAWDDPDAFRSLYDRYAGQLHAFFARRTGSNEVALDLTAETFAQAWIGRRGFRDQAGGMAGPWLFTIARRILMHSVSRRKLETTMLERLQVELPTWHQTDAKPDETWLDGLAADMKAALDGLPHDQRRSVELRVLADLPYSRIANRLGCTPTAARIRVSRGLATLRSRLEGSRG